MADGIYVYISHPKLEGHEDDGLMNAYVQDEQDPRILFEESYPDLDSDEITVEPVGTDTCYAFLFEKGKPTDCLWEVLAEDDTYEARQIARAYYDNLGSGPMPSFKTVKEAYILEGNEQDMAEYLLANDSEFQELSERMQGMVVANYSKVLREYRNASMIFESNGRWFWNR